MVRCWPFHQKPGKCHQTIQLNVVNNNADCPSFPNTTPLVPYQLVENKAQSGNASQLLCWWKKMKENDLGKDYLVPGPVYRAVPSRDTTLPGTEVTPYQLELAKIQVSLYGGIWMFVMLCYHNGQVEWDVSFSAQLITQTGCVWVIAIKYWLLW